jgi:ADP-ribose pyrophosphatase YjhB (NUDIX family)
MDTDNNIIEKQPKLSVVLIIENKKGEMLYQQRLKHPYYGYWGHATGKIRWGETMIEAGARELLEETGLTADLNVAGVYHKMDYEKSTDNLLEDKYFCIIHGINAKGKLITDDEGHHNEWGPPEMTQHGKWFGSLSEIREIVSQPGYTIIEKKYYYDEKDY